MIKIQKISLPLLGGRKYVHSTTFTKFLLDVDSGINQLEIKFRKVSTTANYEFSISTDRQDANSDVHGTCNIGDQIFNFSFMALEAGMQPQKILESTSDINTVISKFDLVDAVVGDSKKLCDNFYDSVEQQLFMVRIELKNIKSIEYPLRLTSEVKKSGSRINVKYRSNNLEIADLLGVIREKNEQSMERSKLSNP